jgi:hypothetical protein
LSLSPAVGLVVPSLPWWSVSRESGSREQRAALENFTVRLSQIIASTSSRLRRWQTELSHSSPLQWRNPLRTLQELGGYVKLNYFCHGSILQDFKLPVLLPPTRLLNVTLSGTAVPVLPYTPGIPSEATDDDSQRRRVSVAANISAVRAEGFPWRIGPAL